MSQHFELKHLIVTKQKPDPDLLDSTHEWEPQKVRTFIEEAGMVLFVKSGELVVSSDAGGSPVTLSAKDLATFDGEGELVFEFRKPTVLCHEVELLFDRA